MKFLLIIILTVLAFWSLLTEKTLIRSKQWTVLLIIRACVLLLFLLALFGVNLFSDIFTPSKNSIVMIIDGSKSMTLYDGKIKNRWQKAADAVMSIESPKKNNKYFFGGSRPERLTDKIQKEFSETTDLNQIIKSAVSLNPQAIVLFSDGNHNASDNPVTLAAGIRIPVHTIGIGPIKDEKTGSLKRIKYPDDITTGESIKLQIETENIKGNSEIIIYNGNSQLLSQKTCSPGKNVIDIDFKPSSSGLQRYFVKLVSSKDTTDQRSFVVNIKNDLINVLYLSNNPGWEARFMRQEFIADRGFNFIQYLWKDLKWERIDNEKSEGNLRDQLNRADVIILHNLTGENLNISLESKIIEQVQNNGKGLLILGLGWIWDFRGRHMYSVVPIVPYSNQGVNEGRMVLSNYVVAAGIFEKTEFENIKSMLLKYPPLQVNGKPRVVTNDVVIMGSLKTPKEEVPLWARQFQVKGRVMQIASEELWPWKIAGHGVLGDSMAYSLILTNCLRWLAGKTEKNVKLSTDRKVYYGNDKVKFQGEIDITKGSGEAQPIWMVYINNRTGLISQRKMIEVSPNRFISEVGKLPPGEYTYQSRVDIDGRSVARMSGKFWMEPLPYHEQERIQNRDLLMEISRVSQGNYWNIDSLPKNNQWLKNINTTSIKAEGNSNSLYPLLIILGLLLIEWFWRRRLGFN